MKIQFESLSSSTSNVDNVPEPDTSNVCLYWNGSEFLLKPITTTAELNLKLYQLEGVNKGDSLAIPVSNSDSLFRPVIVLKELEAEQTELPAVLFVKSESSKWIYDTNLVVFDSGISLKKELINLFTKTNNGLAESDVVNLDDFDDILCQTFKLTDDELKYVDYTDPKEATIRAKASGYYAPNPPLYAFQNDMVNGLGTPNVLPALLMLEFDEPTLIVGYSLYRNSAQPGGLGTNDYSPYVWKFQGSNDKKTLVDLDVRNNVLIPMNQPKKVFMFKNNRKFKYYRIYIERAFNPNTQYVNITEMELLGIDFRLLFVDVDTGKVYKRDNEVLKYVCDLKNLSLKEFNQVFPQMYSFTKQELSKLGKRIKLLAYSEKNSLNGLFMTLEVIPKPKLIVQKEPVSFESYESLESIDFTGEYLPNVKVLIGKANNWYTLQNGNWKLVKQGELDITQDLATVLSEGITATLFSTLLDSKEYEKLFGNDYSDIRFAIALQKYAKLKSISFKFKGKPTYINYTSNCSILYAYNQIIVKFNESGNYIVSYLE